MNPPEITSSAQQGQATGPHAAVTQRPGPLPSAELLQGARTVEISHNGLIYRLQATRLGKLILTK